MTKRLLVLVALLTAALVSGCSTAAPAPTPTKAPAAPTATQGAAPTKAAAPTTVAAPTAAPATQAPAASNYPNKPITWIIPYAAGSASDIAARFVFAAMEKDLGQKITVENKPGGGTIIGLSEIAAAKADGYTLGWAGVWALDYLPLTQETPFKGVVDFTPIAQLHMNNAAIIVRADAPWKTMQDLYDDAKKRPGKISWGFVAGLKGIGHLQSLLWAKAGGGVTFNYIPVNSTVTDILGGTLDVAQESSITSLPQIKAGKLRALLITFETEDFPGLPTAKSLGITNFVPSTVALIGPKGLPADVVAKVAAATKKIVESEAFIKFEKDTGTIPAYLGPEEIAKEAARLAALEREVATEQGWLYKKN